MRKFLNDSCLVKSQRTVVITMIGALLLAGCSKAGPTQVTLQAAKMKQTGGMTAADGGITFWQNGSLSTSINLNKGPVTISVQASGHAVDGQGPEVTVQLNGRPVGHVSVSSTSAREYAINAEVENAGTVALNLNFANHVQKAPELMGRWLKIKSVTVSQGA